MALVHAPRTGIPIAHGRARRTIHPEIKEYMRRHVSNDQDWEKVDDEDSWGVNYIEPTSQIRERLKPSSTPGGGNNPRKNRTR